MKNDKIVSGIKTAGIAVTAAFTMASCGHKGLSESQMQTVQQKTDSALNTHNEYRIASSLLNLCDIKIENHRKANKDIAKIYARDYIKNNIKEAAIKKFMMQVLENQGFACAGYDDSIEADDVLGDAMTTMRYIRQKERWFNDLMLYLNDRYNEKQFLNSEFFKVINSPRLIKSFEHNTQQIDSLKSYADFALGQKRTIHAEVWNKYSDEIKKQR